MKLVPPPGTSSLSHDGADVAIAKNGTIDVEGEALTFFRDACGFPTVEDAADEAQRRAALAEAAALASKRKA